MLLDIVFSLWTKLIGFSPKILNRDVNTAFSASRWTNSGKTIFFGRNYQFQFLLGFWGRGSWTFNEKKFRTVQTGIEVSGGKIWGTNVFFVMVLNLHNCSDCDGNTFNSSAKNCLLSFSNCPVRVQMKDSNEMTFCRTLQFQFFSRLWAEIIQQCYENLILRVQMNLRTMRF